MCNCRFTILACCGLILAAAGLACTQTEGKIIPPAPNTLPEGAKLSVMGAGGPGPQKIQGPGIAKASKPDDKKDDAKKDDAKKGDDKKDDAKKDGKAGDDKKPAGDDKKPAGDGNKDKPSKP
jgi:hypothetical protein